jgi:hypothetical protein
MRASVFAFCLPFLLVVAACGGSPTPNAAQIEENVRVSAENVVDDADERAGMLARQAVELNAQAEEATGARRAYLQNQADALMSEAVNVQRAGRTDAVHIDSDAERAAANRQ